MKTINFSHFRYKIRYYAQKKIGFLEIKPI